MTRRFWPRPSAGTARHDHDGVRDAGGAAWARRGCGDRAATGKGAGKGALIGTGVGAAAGTIYDWTKK